MPLGLDAAARGRVLAAGSFEAALPGGAAGTNVGGLGEPDLPAGHRSLIGLVDRLFSRLEEAEAANHRLRAGLQRARLAALVWVILAVTLVVAVLAVCLLADRLRGLDGLLR